MMRKLIIAALAALLFSSAFAAPAYVNSAFSTATTLVYTPTTAGDDFIIAVIGLGGTPSFSSLSDSAGGETVLTDFGYVNGSGSCGFYRVHSIGSGSHTFTANWTTAPTSWYLVGVEVSGISGVDTGAGTISDNASTSATASSEALTTTANNDFLLACPRINGNITFGTWTPAFTSVQSRSGTTPSWAMAYYLQSTAGAITSQVALSTSVVWRDLQIAYLASGAPVGPPKSQFFFGN